MVLAMWLQRQLLGHMYDYAVKHNDHIIFDNVILIHDNVCEIERRIKNG